MNFHGSWADWWLSCRYLRFLAGIQMGLVSPVGNTHPNPLPDVKSGSGPLHNPVRGSFHLTVISGLGSWLDQCLWNGVSGSFFEKFKIFRVKRAIPNC